MTNVFAFEGFVPVVHQSAFIHPNATVTGNVVIGKDVYVGPGAAIRGDQLAIDAVGDHRVHSPPGAANRRVLWPEIIVRQALPQPAAQLLQLGRQNDIGLGRWT